MEKYELAYADYMKKMSYKDIADKYQVTINTVKSWKQRYWNKKKVCTPKSVHTKNEKGCTPKNKGGAPYGNKNATGPPGNQHNRKHGLFSKFQPAETLALVKEMESDELGLNVLDIMWHNITLQYAAIIRSQQLMYVKDINDKTKEAIEETEYGTKYDVQQAWDKQSKFIQAQSRAMAELRAMLHQYDVMLHQNWSLATEEQKERILNLQAKTKAIINTNDSDDEFESDGFKEALQGSASIDWNAHDN